ncbi:MAG TPA: DUF2892 domain-containing protein [Gemmatimonadales bacterium]|jgi:hypothetical protein|nr:DUF2892 domain-containing protein [Gemmatimonadales bacterium]
MRVNMGRVDRIVRFVLGVVILGLYGALAPPWKYVTLLGLIPLGTSLTGFCPLYAAIGWNRHRTPTGRTP